MASRNMLPVISAVSVLSYLQHRPHTCVSLPREAHTGATVGTRNKTHALVSVMSKSWCSCRYCKHGCLPSAVVRNKPLNTAATSLRVCVRFWGRG